MELYKYFSFLILLGVCSGTIITFKEDNANLTSLYDYFSNIDNIVAVDKTLTKDLFDEYLRQYNVTAFVLPGGSSNITNKSTKYWLFTNLTMQTDKPKIGICLGMQHILKYLTNVTMRRCYLYHTIINSKYHNHKWCIRKNKLEQAMGEKNITFNDIKYFSYNNNEYVEEFQDNKLKVFGMIYHPEKRYKRLIEKNNAILSKIQSFIFQ